VCVCVCVCVIYRCVCLCVCVYIYIYIDTCTLARIYVFLNRVDLMSGLQLDSIPEKGIDYIRDFVPLVRAIQVFRAYVL
jgi:hypothetical protein